MTESKKGHKLNKDSLKII